MMLEDVLSRTLLLMRGDLVAEVTDDVLVAALTGVSVVIAADAQACATRSGQSAIVATALTVARSGHEVWLDCPDVPLVGHQPPLRGTNLREAILEAGDDLLPGRRISSGRPDNCDLAVVLGRVLVPVAGRILRFDADDWSMRLGGVPAGWSGGAWPVGALAIAPLAAAEAFKHAMRSLATSAASPGYFDLLYAPADEVRFEMAPAGTPHVAQLPDFDIVSGGAIANALLFALLRVPGLVGHGRVLDDDLSALSNLNRNALLRRSAAGVHKVVDLAVLSRASGVTLASEPLRFEAGMALAPTVLVGVDDIPSRWAVQSTGPVWTGVGATDRFSVLVSSHGPGQPCSGCLHPVAPPPSDAPIPTCAFVSFLSGLLLAARWLGELGGFRPEQQTFLNALRPEGWEWATMPLAPAERCPVGCDASVTRKAA